MTSLDTLLARVRACNLCAAHLPHGTRPVLAAHRDARILIVGQAPGRRVHESGIPWDDPSGERLRAWLGVDIATFYDPQRFAILPMGFCYPGTGKSGDLAPRPECAPEWHDALLEAMPNLRLRLWIGRYAQRHYLGPRRAESLTATARAWRDFRPSALPLPHPSPRNNLWLAKNPWFEAEVLPYLRRRVRALIRE